MKDDNMTINSALVEMFGIPKDATAATLRMRAGTAPTLTVMRKIFRPGQLDPERKMDRYKLVPIDGSGAA